jgi:hypothetical protein
VFEYLNPYRNIEFVPAQDKFKVIVGSHPQRLVGLYDTLPEATRVRDLAERQEKHALRQTSVYAPYNETRSAHAA